ncbi:MAG: hypothetical protein CL609_17385 [Anaerolineaceae bacterium]|nr:hypothetical protein [Anaerolineaceae bacterium]
MKFDCIIFDIDGTLGDTLYYCIEAFHITLAEINHRTYTDEEITQYFGTAEEGILKHLVSPELYPQVLQTYYRVYEDLQKQHIQLFPAVRPMLNKIHQAGLTMAVVTGKGPTTAEIALRDFELLAYFDSVEFGSMQKKSKLASLKKTLDTLQCLPDRTVYIGDTNQDMLDAQACGMWGAGAAWASTATLKQEDWNGRVRVFETIESLETWLLT